MTYDAGTRKTVIATIVVVVTVPLLAACVTPSQAILTHANSYAFYLNDYETICVDNIQFDKCDAYYAAVVDYKKKLVAAAEAKQRGGKYKLQLKALETARANAEAINAGRP